MSKPIVYLAGAIANVTGAHAVDWRHQATQALMVRQIETRNPMRAKEYAFKRELRIASTFHAYEAYGAFFTSRGIMTRDFNDVKQCDALLVNLLALTKPSLGTIMELAWAYAFQKPAVVAIEDEGNPHDGHPMIHEAIPFRVRTLDEAIDSVAIILGR